MLQVVRMGGGVQAGAGQLVKGWGEQGAEASAGAGVGEVDGVRRHGWRVSISSSPAVIVSSFFFSGAVLFIVCAHIALATALDMRAEKLVGGIREQVAGGVPTQAPRSLRWTPAHQRPPLFRTAEMTPSSANAKSPSPHSDTGTSDSQRRSSHP